MKNSRISFGFLRAAVVSPEMRVADVDFNTSSILTALDDLAARGCQLAVFPELCIPGYSCADLFYQSVLLKKSLQALDSITAFTGLKPITAVVGFPLELDGRIYNCAALVNGGKILGIVPKTYLPNTNEYYEERWFTSAVHCKNTTVEINRQPVPMGTDLIFTAWNMPECKIGIEICEDLWSANPPSGNMALAGATLFLNLSASNELLGKADYRRDLVKNQSARCLAAYLYSAAGPGESTTDVVFSGHSLIAENGILLGETNRFQFSTQAFMSDIDLQRITYDRMKDSSFSAAEARQSYRMINFQLPDTPVLNAMEILRPLPTTPFVPADPTQRARHCREIFNIQSTGLAKRLRHTGSKQVTIAVSGGLDSTLALLVTIKAFDLLNLKRDGIHAVSMPGMGTTSRTQANAEQMARLLGVTFRNIPIHAAVMQHFKDIGHDENVHDTTYENTQARERTQIVMDMANQISGFMVGTGDLSELALGWCTYNGDHMSMYHVNAGVPKTLVRYLVEWAAESEFEGETSRILQDICATPITPELLPTGEDESLQQKTEDTIGPYILHDFFLFYTIRHLFSPRKIFFLAGLAFQDKFSGEEILKWLKLFYRRFFTHQFKRSAMPDGPKVGSVALSPRGDWRMPSDASPAVWLEELDELELE